MAWLDKCPKCSADLEVVGVTASVRETVLYMGKFGEPGLQRIAAIGAREVDTVECRSCGVRLPAQFAEGLVAA